MNIVDERQLEEISRQINGTPPGIRIPDPVLEAVQHVTAPIQEVFVAVPSLPAFVGGTVFGAGLVLVVEILMRVIIRP